MSKEGMMQEMARKAASAAKKAGQVGLCLAALALMMALCAHEAHADGARQEFRVDGSLAGGGAYSSTFTAEGDPGTETYAVWVEDRSGTAPELAAIKDAEVTVTVAGESVFDGPLSGIDGIAMAKKANCDGDAVEVAYSIALPGGTSTAVAGAANLWWCVQPLSGDDLASLDASQSADAAEDMNADDAAELDAMLLVATGAGVVGCGVVALCIVVWRRIKVEGPTQES